MNILYYHKDYDTPMYQWQHIHIIDELKHHDCNIHVFNPLRYNCNDEANKALLNHVKKTSPDLFMTPHTSKDIYIQTVESIKRMGIPTMLICFDNLYVPFVHYDIAPHFDLVWLTAKETKHLFDRLGCNTVFLPYAANPYIKTGNEEVDGIGFVGTPYGSRANMINLLTQNGIPVYCHCKRKGSSKTVTSEGEMSKVRIVYEFLRFKEGRRVLEGAIVNKLKKTAILDENDCLHLEESVPFEQLYNNYSKYSLALSSTAVRNTGVLKNPLNVANLRCFEIPMAGGIQLCRYTEEIASYFKENEEIILYKDNDEMIDKAKYYIDPKNSNIRKKIRQQARNRAEHDHTWWNRFSEVFDQLGIKH